MANINSLTTSSNSSTSSLYGTRNVLSGLATGMDTESMIQNSVTGYQTKITQLQQQQTKYEWKQDSYRGIIDSVAAFTQKYTSYTSSTNLMSAAFFSNNVTTTTAGEYANLISAVGRSTSAVQINAVTQLAAAARYTVSADSLAYNSDLQAIGTPMNWNEPHKASEIAGSSLTLTIGTTKVSIDFDANDVYEDAASLAEGIKAKLAKADYKDGTADFIDVQATGGTLTFTDTRSDNGGDALYISSVSGALKTDFGVQSGTLSDRIQSFTIPSGKSLFTATSLDEYITGQSVSVTLDGVTKEISLKGFNDEENPLPSGASQETKTRTLADYLQDRIDSVFGSGRVSVSAVGTYDPEQGEDLYGLRFDVAPDSGSTLQITSSVSQSLGLGKDGITNYLNTSRTLGELLDGYGALANDANTNFNPENAEQIDSNTWQDPDTGVTATKINSDVWQDDDGKYFDKDGNYLEKLEINGETVGYFGKDDTLDHILTSINSSAAGVNVTFSRLTGEFSFVTQETGAGQKIEFGEGLASRLFRGDETQGDPVFEYQAGTDAKLETVINGKTVSLTRSSNVVSLDGMNITLKGTFSAYEENEEDPGVNDVFNPSKAVTFNSSSNADNIVDALKSFVEQYNTIAKSIHDAYATQPAYKNSSSRSRYEPLTDSDKEGMSETAIKNYEEKAKQGLLFGDTDLSSFYSQLINAISPGGADRIAMESIGLTTSYSDGVTTLTLKEDVLRSALDSNPDSVRTVFTGTGDSGNGLMSRLKSTMDAYASTSYANPGILVSKAGSKLNSSSLLSNALQQQIDNIQTQIENWQTKMSTKIDYYTRQFTTLEKLMSSLNSQSSMLTSMMGG